LAQPASVRLLTIPMVEPSFRAPLVAPVGGAPLPAACLVAATGAAVAVSSIAVSTDEKDRLAALTKAEPLPQNRFAVNHRHASSQAELDNGSGLVSGWNQLCLVTCRWLPNTGDPAARTAGFHFSPQDKILRSAKLVDDRTADCAFGAMMSQP
jgi:hypothetical protein